MVHCEHHPDTPLLTLSYQETGKPRRSLRGIAFCPDCARDSKDVAAGIYRLRLVSLNGHIKVHLNEG